MSEQSEIWAKVFARLLLRRITNPTFQATYQIPEDLADNRCFKPEQVERCTKSDDAAYDLFISEFSRLRPDWQVKLTDRTVSQWNEYDRERRYGKES